MNFLTLLLISLPSFFSLLVAQSNQIVQINELKKNLPSSSSEPSLKSYFDLANRYYQNQNYQSALKIYEKMVFEILNDFKKNKDTEGIVDNEFFLASLYYNQGNSYYKLHNIHRGNSTNQYLARAVLSYRRALNYRPGHSPTLHNLDLIRQQIDSDSQAAKNPTEIIHHYFLSRINVWTHFLGVIFLILLTTIGLYTKFRRHSLLQRWLKIAIFLISGIYLTGFIVIMSSLAISPKAEKAIIKQTYSIKAEPNTSPNNIAVFLLNEGSEVTVIRFDPSKRWVEIEQNNRRGWIEKENLFYFD